MTITTYRKDLSPEAQSQLATLGLKRLVENKDLLVLVHGPRAYLEYLRKAIAEGERILRLLGEIELIKPLPWIAYYVRHGL